MCLTDNLYLLNLVTRKIMLSNFKINHSQHQIVCVIKGIKIIDDAVLKQQHRCCLCVLFHTNALYQQQVVKDKSVKSKKDIQFHRFSVVCFNIVLHRDQFSLVHLTMKIGDNEFHSFYVF